MFSDFLDPGKIILNALVSILGSFIDQAVSTIISVYTNIAMFCNTILGYPIVNNIYNYSQGIAISFFIIKIILEVYNKQILQNRGEPDEWFIIIQKIVIGVFCIFGIYPFIKICMTLTQKACDEIGAIRDIGNLKAVDGDGLQSLLKLQSFDVSTSFLAAIVIIVAIIVIVIIIIQAAERCATLAVLLIIGPIMAIWSTSENNSKWQGWVQSVMSLCGSIVLQSVLLKLSIVITVSYNTDQMFLKMGIFIGFLIFTMKSPAFLDSLIQRSNVAGMMGAGAKSLGTVAITKLLTK
jgi:hypothetical protein